MKIFYLRNAKGLPVVCVASQLTKAAGQTALIQFAISAYNPKDRFDKKSARRVAVGRLLSGAQVHTVYVDPERGKTKEAIVRKVASIAASQASKEAARLWLQTMAADKLLSEGKLL